MKKLVITFSIITLFLTAGLVYSIISIQVLKGKLSEQKNDNESISARLDSLSEDAVGIKQSLDDQEGRIKSLASRLTDFEDEQSKSIVSANYANSPGRVSRNDFLFTTADDFRSDIGEVFVGEFKPGSADVADLDRAALAFLDSLMSRDDISVLLLGTADKLRWNINGQTVNPLVHNSLNEIKKLERAENLNARYQGRATTGIKAGEYRRRGVLVSWYTLPKQPVEPTSGAVTFKAFELDSLPQQVAIPTAIMLVNRNVNQPTNGHNQSTVMDTLRAGQSLTFNNGVYSGLVFAEGFQVQEKSFAVDGRQLSVIVYLKRNPPLPPPPSVVSNFWSDAKFGLFAGGSGWHGGKNTTVTSPVFGISLSTPDLMIKLGGGYRWFSANDRFGNRTESQILAEINYYPLKNLSNLGFSVGVDGRWENVDSQNEFLVNSWGLTLGPRLRSNRLSGENSGLYLDAGVNYNPSRVNRFGTDPSMNWDGISGTINLNYKF